MQAVQQERGTFAQAMIWRKRSYNPVRVLCGILAPVSTPQAGAGFWLAGVAAAHRLAYGLLQNLEH